MRTVPDWVPLAYETMSARNLLRDGIEALLGIQMDAWHADSTVTLLSIGVEKLIKLTLGMISREETGTWTVPKNHQLVPLNDTMIAALRRRSDALGLSNLVADLDALTALPHWTTLLEALHNYGMAGRFYYLDQLGGTQQQYRSPRDYWEDVITTVMEDDPEILADFASVERYPAGRKRANDKIAHDVLTWHTAVRSAWVRGVAGQQAKQFAADLDLNVPRR